MEKITEININGTDYSIAGESAYEVAVRNGFEGTEEEWLESLVEKVGNIVQTTGDSATDVMSQKATTKGIKSIFSDIDTLLNDNLISRHIDFTNESVSNSGETYNASTRLLSNFFEITDNAKYNISLESTKDAIIEYLFYDESKTLITFTDWNPPFFKTKDGYKYVRLLIKNNTNTDISPADYEYNDWLKVNLTDVYRRDITLENLTWENKTINESNGTLSNASSRCTSELLPIREDDIIFVLKGKTDALWYQVHYYYEDGSTSVANYYTHVDRNYPIPHGCVGIRLQFRKSDNSNMPSMDDFLSTVGDYTCYTIRDQAELKKTTKHKFTVAHQNIRVFNYSGGTKGCPNDEVDANLPRWKANISNWLNADVLNIDEWHNKFDQAGNIDAYAELLQQFYPYYYDTGNGKALFSKHPCTFNEIFIDQRLIVCDFITEGEKIAVVGWISSNTYEPSRRITAYNALINYLGRYDKAIVLGDFNNDHGAEELQVFTDNGYTLGNNGYWGEIDTCPSDNPFTAIDNIITKGFIFEEFSVGDDSVTSDHYPIKAKLAFFK
jgi:hypothetical protein